MADTYMHAVHDGACEVKVFKCPDTVSVEIMFPGQDFHLKVEWTNQYGETRAWVFVRIWPHEVPF